MSSWLVLMRRVLAVVAVAACVLLCGVEGQGNVCDLANSDGSASYSLQSLGVLTTGIFQVGLQRTFSKGYIAFCQGKPVACTTKTTAGGWACLTSPDGQIMEILCPNQPVGQFLDSSAPQLGATFTCTSLGGTVTNGFIGCGPAGAGFAALTTTSGGGASVKTFDLVVPASIYCNNSNTKA